MPDQDSVLRAERARWESFYEDRGAPRPFFTDVPDENLHEWLASGLLRPGRALDIGCGNGRNALFMARQGCRVTAIDFSDSAIAWAREMLALAPRPVDLWHGSVFDAALPAGCFDLVYDSGCFHHLAPHLRSAYVELVARALKPGGHFGLVCFAPEGGSGRVDDEVYAMGSVGGGLGYDAAALHALWSPSLEVLNLRRMTDRPPGDATFGRAFLWSMLARKAAGDDR